MSATPFPRTLDLRKPAMHKAHFEGSLAPAQLPRLRGLLADDAGVIDAVVSCDLDDSGRTVLSVRVNGLVSVRCQRCLELFQRPLTAESRLAVVRTDEQAASLPETLEPLLAEREVDLWSVVEDELVLAMPVYSYHDDESCIEQLAGAGFVPAEESGESAPKTAGDNPFSVLAQLKRDSSH